MKHLFEVKVHCEKPLESGKIDKIAASYLVEAPSCIEAEAQVAKAITPYCSAFIIPSINRTKIEKVIFNEYGDTFYKVKINYITYNEKNMTEKVIPETILVKAVDFFDAFARIKQYMLETTSDIEIVSIAKSNIEAVIESNIENLSE